MEINKHVIYFDTSRCTKFCNVKMWEKDKKNKTMHLGHSDLPFLILIERVNTKIYQKDKVMEDPAE